ncbi:VanZ family protein [Lutispora saccharofermentans]|uniref:VanZ family protein n=1 Tax=Lutispora saccharofermentans TaxID=3024236 RepID=A0ABT1NIT2_9FIRM|nr:VanZ family protein [Lutispora saccharofermentans]MCQ1531192.1 VanZ family protein [Lutispora saccharofermentans]
MDIITIFQVLLRWGVFALIGGLLLALTISVGYMIYKKAFHGQKSMSKTQGIILFLLSCWLLLVLALTTLSRGANFTGSFNIDFFSAYVNAWNKWSISELQLIIFNMLMFTPLGFLLPLFWKKAEKFKVTLFVSIGLTVCIEIVQLLTGTGIFELDDLFHNCIGSMLGYFCIMAVLSIIRERRVRFVPIGKVLILPCVIGMIIGTVSFVYEQQPYGNMPILPAAKQDMSMINLTADLSLTEQPAWASIYKNTYAEDQDYIERIIAQLSESEDVIFSGVQRREGENRVYTGKSPNSEDVQLNFFFRTGHWRYTTWRDTATLTEEAAKSYGDFYKNWLKESGLLPDTAVFSIQNNDTLRWDAPEENDLSIAKTAFTSGSILMQFDSNLELTSMHYGISWNEYVATEEIISPKAAFKKVEDGNFEQYVPFRQGDTLWVKECKLAYVYDTKGFYQPVYRFTGYINNNDNSWDCQIPALAK